MASTSVGKRVDAVPYVCPTCDGKTYQYRPINAVEGRVKLDNTVRVDHRSDCERWACVQAMHPGLIAMRREAVRV